MPDTSPSLPAIVRHYAAYLRAKAHLTPHASVSGGKADVAISIGGRVIRISAEKETVNDEDV